MRTRETALIGAILLSTMFLMPSIGAGAPSEADWRYLLYLDADNDLDVSAGQFHIPVVQDDLDELMSVGSTDDVACYVLVDRWTGPANLFKVQKGDLDEMTDFDLNGVEANMGDPATLRAFVEYTFSDSPAERTVLMFWNHGTPNYVAWDDNGPSPGVSDILTHLEVAEALDGYTVDVIGTDECLVGQIEVAYQYALDVPGTQYLLASETYTGWRGYPYDWTLQRMVDEPSMSPREVAIMFIEETERLLNAPPYQGEAITCHAAIDLSMMRELVSSFSDLVTLLADEVGIYNGAISRARGAASYSYGVGSIDLIDFRVFVQVLAKSVPSDDVKSACRAVLDSFEDAVITLQVPRSLQGKIWGLGIRFANHESSVPAYYWNYAMPQEFWLDFLEEYWYVNGK